MTAITFHERAVAAWREGDLARALPLAMQAHAEEPGASLHRNMVGILHASLGDAASASQWFRSALVAAPGDAAIWCNLGHANRNLHAPLSAVVGYRRSLAGDPNVYATYVALAEALCECGQAAAARRVHRRVVAAMPHEPEAWYRLGLILIRIVDPRAGLALQRASALAPLWQEPYNDLGIWLFGRSELPAALSAFQKVLRISPPHVQALSNAALALQRLGRFPDARICCSAALALQPALAAAHSNLAGIDEIEFQHGSSILRYRRALAIGPSATLHSSLLCTMAGAPEIGNDTLFDECLRWGTRYGAVPALPPPRAAIAADVNQPLRIGWCSADLTEHPVAHTLIGFLEHRDRTAFKAIVYADNRQEDAMTDRLRRAADAWRNIHDVSDIAVAEAMRADGIDILVTVAGHTLHNRVRVAAFRPAALQVSIYDFISSGLTSMDAWLTDATLHPPSTTERFTETLVRLPCLFLYEPPEDAPAAAPPPVVRSGIITFGSMNSPRKYNAGVFEAWARILNAVPASRLVMKYTNAYESASLRRLVLAAFASHDVASDRIQFLTGASDRREHLRMLEKVDIALDPFPFNGSNTSFEALWMGVPVITLAGERAMGRVTASLLAQIGLTDLAANDIDTYVELAIGLAGDVERLERLREALRGRLTRSLLCDPGHHAHALESALREVWRTKVGL